MGKNEEKEIPGTVVSFTADRKFYCIYHKDKELVFYQAKLLEFELEQGSGKSSHATDLTFMCPECGLIFTFGVCISKEQFLEMRQHAVDINPDAVKETDV